MSELPGVRTDAPTTGPVTPVEVTDGSVVAVHPERTADPLTLRWYVPGPALPRAEEPHGGGALAALVALGVLADAEIGPEGLTTTLASGRSWPQEGAAVREAVQATVAAARARPARPPAERDAALRQLAELVVGGAGPYAASHGGRIELVSVQDDVVSVRLGGACHGCPAQAFTVHRRLEADLRHGAPWLREVTVVEQRPGAGSGADCALPEGSTRRPLVLFRSRPPGV